MPRLEDVPKDIYELFNPDKEHVVNEENIEEFGENLKQLLKDRLGGRPPSSSAIRFSSLGRPDRQVWFNAHPPGEGEAGEERLIPKTYFKFLYGDVIEQLILFLVKEAGHEVSSEQAELEIDGILGHIDAIIDGVVVDVKSASPFGYQKFEKRTITEDDPFGYVDQLAGYATCLTPGEPAAWLAMDKVHGDICVTPLSKAVISHHPPSERIRHLKEVVASDVMPEPCYQPVPDGQSGNMKLDTGCSYCQWKFRCWPSVRTFLYSTGPRYLTEVVRVPNVPEITSGTN